MNRLLEILFGLDRGFLSREGDFSFGFNPQWPFSEVIGTTEWNVLLVLLGLGVVWYAYKHEGRSQKVKVALAVVRAVLVLLTITLLNRPALTLTQSRVEPSVMAILIDNSLSMRIRDVGSADTLRPRVEAVAEVLNGENAKLLNDLAKIHQLRFYRFDADATAIDLDENRTLPAIEPMGQKTQVTTAIRTVLHDLQGQRVAGVVVFSDGRDMPQQSIASAIEDVKDFGVGIYPVPVGSDQPLRNIDLQQVSANDAVFARDIASIRATVRVTGPAGQPVTVRLKEKGTGLPIPDASGRPAEKTITPADDSPQEVELLIRPDEVGTMNIIVEADVQPGEIDETDNAREIQLAVLDAQVNVLYVDGYPRWDYRYLKTEMMRDRTVNISCLLTSADPTFAQEGDRPITRFPQTPEELADYDVILFGDVDPREFSDSQLQLVADFVSRRGGGFAMTAGPRYSPHAWKGTPLEALLPVDITRTQAEEWGVGGATIAEGFRPVLTAEGQNSPLFRFFHDRAENDQFLREGWQPIFWYTRGVIAKPGVSEVLAEHPTDIGPDGRRAPIIVAGRYGAGRTIFNGIDESWRWRYYTGEAVFDTFWVQQIRFLARSRKLGQRKITLTTQKPVYDLGQQVRLNVRVIDPQLLSQLPDQIRVQLLDEAGQLIGQPTLVKQEGGENYIASFPADRVGRFVVKLPSVAPGVDELTLPVVVAVPKLELSTPQVDRTTLARLASETGGQVIDLASAREKLPEIPSAQRLIPLQSSQPLWDAPLALALFAVLITVEWVGRKLFGMV